MPFQPNMRSSFLQLRVHLVVFQGFSYSDSSKAQVTWSIEDYRWTSFHLPYGKLTNKPPTKFLIKVKTLFCSSSMEVNEASADNKEVKENHGFSDWWFQPNGLDIWCLSLGMGQIWCTIYDL